MALKPNADASEAPIEATPEPVALAPGFHVMLDGASLGCYLTAADAEAFADGHPRADGLTVTVAEVK